MLKSVIVQVLKNSVLVESADVKPAVVKKEEVKDGQDARKE